MSRRELKFCCLNVHSLRTDGKLEQLQSLLMKRKIDVTFLQETWHEFGKSGVIGKLERAGYTVVEQARPVKFDAQGRPIYRGGVLAMVLRNSDISVRKIPYVDFRTTHFEYTVAKIACKSRGWECYAIVLYRPGGSVVEPGFFADLADLLARVCSSGRNIILAGDVNIHLNVDGPNSGDFLDVIEDVGLRQHVNVPTRVCNMLDVVCTRFTKAPKIAASDVDLSDHRLLTWSLFLPAATVNSTAPVRGRKRPLSDGH